MIQQSSRSFLTKIHAKRLRTNPLKDVMIKLDNKKNTGNMIYHMIQIFLIEVKFLNRYSKLISLNGIR